GGEQHVPLAAGQLRLAGDNESAALLELHGAVVRRLAAQAQLVEVIGRGGPVELDQAEALDRAGHDEDDLAGARLELERPLWVNVEFGAGGLAVVVAVEDDGIALADGDLIGGFRHGPPPPRGGRPPTPPRHNCRWSSPQPHVRQKRNGHKKHKKSQQGEQGRTSGRWTATADPFRVLLCFLWPSLLAFLFPASWRCGTFEEVDQGIVFAVANGAHSQTVEFHHSEDVADRHHQPGTGRRRGLEVVADLAPAAERALVVDGAELGLALRLAVGDEPGVRVRIVYPRAPG